MAADSRHGQLPHPEGGEDLGEIRHEDGLVLGGVGHARLPIIRVALSTKINSRRIRFEFEWPGTYREFGILAIDLLGDASLHHDRVGVRQEGQDGR